MRRFVFDTSVIVAGLRSRQGASFRLLYLLHERKLALACTPSLFLEYEDVLKRPEQRLAHKLSERQVDRFLAELAALLEPVEVHFQWRPQIADADDEMVFEAAVNGGVDALVTHNIGDFAQAAKRFHLRVLTPGECLMEFL
jgi:putative PIN family toxin of toxin-antitoxin system